MSLSSQQLQFQLLGSSGPGNILETVGRVGKQRAGRFGQQIIGFDYRGYGRVSHA